MRLTVLVLLLATCLGRVEIPGRTGRSCIEEGGSCEISWCLSGLGEVEAPAEAQDCPLPPPESVDEYVCCLEPGAARALSATFASPL